MTAPMAGAALRTTGSIGTMKRLAIATLLFFTAGLMTPATTAAQAKAPTSPLAIPVTGAGGGAVFTGTFQLQKFATDQAGRLVASGVLTGVVTTAAGATTRVVPNVSVPPDIT